MSDRVFADEPGGTSRPPAEAVARAVLHADGVVSMSAGPLGQFRAYLASGASVPGVRWDDDAVTVNIVCHYAGLAGIGPAVGDALGRLDPSVLAGRSVHLQIDDIVLPGEPADRQDRADSVLDAPRESPA